MSTNISGQTSQQSTSQEAKEQGREVASHAKEEAASVAGAVRDEAGAVAQTAQEQARGLFHDVQQQVRDQGEQQVARLGGALQTLSSNLQALQEGRTEDAGALADYLERARTQVDDLGRRVEDLGLSGVLEEMRRFARRRPAAFLGAAAVAGMVVGRIARGGRDARQQDDSERMPLPSTIPTTRPATATQAPPPAVEGSGSGTAAGPIADPDVVVVPDATAPPQDDGMPLGDPDRFGTSERFGDSERLGTEYVR